MLRVQLPPGLADERPPSGGNEVEQRWRRWLASLPALVADLLDQWQLTPQSPATSRRDTLDLAVRTLEGAPAVLQVGWPHEAAEHEHVALKTWAGHGAVRLLRADPRRFALLLERVSPEDLAQEWDVAACETVGALYATLHVPAPPQLRTLSSSVARWAEELAALPREAPVPHRLVQQATSIARAFTDDPATDGVLVHGDLHYAKVHPSGRDGGWLATAPRPLSGDPHHEVAPLLWHRFDETRGDVRRALRARFHAVVDAAGLDEDRARDWAVLRAVVGALQGLDGLDGLRPLDPTVGVAIAKAVQE